MTAVAGGTASIGQRLEWPDAFRGLTICVIILFHAAQCLQGFGFDELKVVAAIKPLQLVGLALFFAISGMNSTRYIDADWAECWRERLWPMVWLLLLWGPIIWGVSAILPGPHSRWGGDPRQIVMTWLTPTSVLWFLWSLVAYLVATRLARTHRAIGLAIGVLLSTFMLGMTDWHLRHHGLGALTGHFGWRMAATFFLFFYLGYCCRDAILRASRLPLWRSLILFAGGARALLWLKSFAASAILGGLIGLSALLVGLIGTIFAARVLLLIPLLRPALLWLGRMTLPLYLSHMLFIVPMAYALHAAAPPALRAMPGLLALAVGAIALTLAILFALVAPHVGLMWLFRPPLPFTQFRPRAAADELAVATAVRGAAQ